MKSLARQLLFGFSLLLPFGSGAFAEALRTEVSVVADLPLAQSWDKLQDFSVAHNYVPNLSKTEIVSTQRNGIGAHRRVYDEDGDYLEETITEWQEGEGFVIKLHSGEEPMMPFNRAEFSYRLASWALRHYAA